MTLHVNRSGVRGAVGPVGSQILTGTGAPSGLLGVDGDVYIDTSGGDIYGPKASGVWPAAAQSARHTIYGGGSTPSVATLYNDAGGVITMAEQFYRYLGGTAGWRVRGGRVYVPAGATGLTTLTGMAYVTYQGVALNLAATPLRTKTLTTIVAGAWNDFIFDKPLTVDEYDRAWIAYTFGDQHYIADGNQGTTPTQASDGSAIYHAGDGQDGIHASAFRIGSSSTDVNNSGLLYGIDIIFDEGGMAGSPGEPGNEAVPLSAYGWKGATVHPDCIQTTSSVDSGANLVYLHAGQTITGVKKYIHTAADGLPGFGLNGYALYNQTGSVRLGNTADDYTIWNTGNQLWENVPFLSPIAIPSSGLYWLAHAVNVNAGISCAYQVKPSVGAHQLGGFRRSLWSMGSAYGSAWPSTVNFATAGNDQTYMACFGLY